jgi:uncharacterized protein (DUF362 family)
MRAEPIVAVQACDTYDRDAVEASVRAGLDAIGGLESFVRPGDRVFCKLNLLISPARRDHAITTHPEVVRAIIHEVRRVGAVPLVSDNPALKRIRRGARLRVSGYPRPSPRPMSSSTFQRSRRTR